MTCNNRREYKIIKFTFLQLNSNHPISDKVPENNNKFQVKSKVVEAPHLAGLSQATVRNIIKLKIVLYS